MLVWSLESDEKEEIKTIRRVFEDNLKDEGLKLEHDIEVLIVQMR